MLQPPDSQKNSQFASTPNYTPVKTASAPLEQATIGRTLVIKGDISGAESLYIDGRVEGTINIPENRVTIGRNGAVTADVNAKEVVIMRRRSCGVPKGQEQNWMLLCLARTQSPGCDARKRICRDCWRLPELLKNDSNPTSSPTPAKFSSH